MRIDEINTRLAAINGELDTATGEALAALETEVETLTAERQAILDEAQTRQQLRNNIAAGIVAGELIENNQEDNNMENRNYTPASEEYRSAFLKHLRGEEMTEVEKRAFVFLTNNTAAVLPEVMQNRIIDLISEAHPIVADVYTLRSNSVISIPVAKEIVFDATQTAEGNITPEMQITFDTVTLGGKDYTGNVKLTYQMSNMAIPAFEEYLVTQIAERLGARVANDIVFGIADSLAEGQEVEGGITYENICKAFGALKRVGTVVVYGSRKAIYEKLVGMVDANKRPIFQQAITAGAAGTLLGCQIKVEDAVEDDILLIGDPKKFVQNVVAPIMIETAKDLDTHKITYSGYTCQEGALTDPRAFAIVVDVA